MKKSDATTEDEVPKQRLAPSGVRQHVYGRNLRKELVDRLDAENPEYAHMYQHPGLVTGDQRIIWDAESKGQELVKDAQGRVLHHMGDPVVRVKREEFTAAREFEAQLSREDVEAVVKPHKSTVKRAPKTPVEIPKKK